MKHHTWAILFVAAFMLVIAAACAGPPASPALPSPTAVSKQPVAKADWERKWDSALAGAKREGTLSVYGTMAREGLGVITSKLWDKFGINLEILAGRESELVQKITVERRAGIHNVDMTLFPPMSYINYLKPAGTLTPLAPYLILPDVKDDKNWLNGKFPMFDKDGTVVALSALYMSYVAINTEVVKEGEIRSYRDLLNPRWKGKMVMLDPTFTGSSETMVNYFIPRVMGVEAGEKYLRELVKQDITYTRDARLLVESVAKKKYPIGIAAASSLVGDFVVAGASISFVRFEEGGALLPASTCLTMIDNAPHPNAATVFLNWVLTEEGQGIFAAGRNAPPRRLGVPFAGPDQFGVVRPGDKMVEVDEAFYLEGAKTANWAKDIFGPAVTK